MNKHPWPIRCLKALEILHGKEKVAETLGLQVNTLYKFAHAGSIPSQYHRKLVELSEGIFSIRDFNYVGKNRP